MKAETRAVPANLVAEAKEWREKMVEAAAEADDDLMHKYLEGHNLSNEDIKKGLRIRTIKNQIVPMLCGSAFKNKGVQARSEEHTSELQSLTNLVCRLLLEKKKNTADILRRFVTEPPPLPRSFSDAVPLAL